jgi:hypothetical protein
MPAKEFVAFTRLDASDVNAYLANKSISNAVINGGFDFWQRGTSFTNPANFVYTADRWRSFTGSTGATRVISRQAFSPNEINAQGFGDSQFYLRVNQSVAGTGDTFNQVQTPIEDVRTFAGQTVTLSFWAKANATLNLITSFEQNFGSGGSSTVATSQGTTALTTSWQRYTKTSTLPSISGKTIGSNSLLAVVFGLPNNATFTIDIWGVQLEPGTVANDFRRNANSIQGELAACQRYYQRVTAGGAYGSVTWQGVATSTTAARIVFPLKTSLRTIANVVESGNVILNDGANVVAAGTITLAGDNSEVQTLTCTTTGLTQFRPYILSGNNNAAGFIAISAEL